MFVQVPANKTCVCAFPNTVVVSVSPSVARVETIDAVATNTLHFLIGKIVKSLAGGKSIWITPTSEIHTVVLSAGTGVGERDGERERVFGGKISVCECHMTK